MDSQSSVGIRNLRMTGSNSGAATMTLAAQISIVFDWEGNTLVEEAMVRR